MSTDGTWLVFPPQDWQPTAEDAAAIADVLAEWGWAAHDARARDVSNYFSEGSTRLLRSTLGALRHDPRHLLFELELELEGYDIELFDEHFGAHAMEARIYLGPRIHVPHCSWTELREGEPLVFAQSAYSDFSRMKGARWGLCLDSMREVIDTDDPAHQVSVRVSRKKLPGRNPFTGAKIELDPPEFPKGYKGFCRSYLEVEFQRWPTECGGQDEFRFDHALLDELTEATGTTWVGFMHSAQG